MSVKRQIFINNKDIDGKIANNTTFDFDFNVDKNILEKIKAKKESNKLNTKDWTLFSLMVLFIFAMGVVSGWLAFNCLGIGEVRNDMENFKLMTVAKTMGIEIDENKLHDATYDIELTRDIFYKIINKMDVKL